MFSFYIVNYVDLAMPFGQMPILEVDGIRVHQSGAISRYIAKRVGLAGSNDWESLQIDIVADTFNDFRLSEFMILSYFCFVLLFGQRYNINSPE